MPNPVTPEQFARAQRIVNRELPDEPSLELFDAIGRAYAIVSRARFIDGFPVAFAERSATYRKARKLLLSAATRKGRANMIFDGDLTA